MFTSKSSLGHALTACQRASAPSRSVCPNGLRCSILAACRRNVACGERHLQVPPWVCRWPEARQDRRRRRSCRWRRRSRRAGTMPTRRCSICAGSAALLPPPVAMAAMLAAPTRSRCPWNLQWGQRKRRVPGLGTRRRHATHVEKLPRSSTSRSLGRLVVRLANSSMVPSRLSSLPDPVAPPAARAMLTPLGCAPAHRSLAGLPVMQVQPTFGADRPAGYQQSRVLGHHGIRMNDPEIHPRCPTRIQGVLHTRHGRRDREPQEATFRKQGDGADMFCWIRDGSSQSDPELCTPFGHRQAHPQSIQLEDSVVEAHRYESMFAPRKPGILSSFPALGRLEPGTGIPPEYRSGTDSG